MTKILKICDFKIEMLFISTRIPLQLKQICANYF